MRAGHPALLCELLSTSCELIHKLFGFLFFQLERLDPRSKTVPFKHVEAAKPLTHLHLARLIERQAENA